MYNLVEGGIVNLKEIIFFFFVLKNVGVCNLKGSTLFFLI